MIEHIYQLGISSADAIRLYPEFDFEDGKKKIQNNHRSRSGRGWNYLFSTFNRFDIPIDFISANNASLVNSWWDSNAELLLFKSIQISSVDTGYLDLLGGGGLGLLAGGDLEILRGTELYQTTSTEVYSVYIVNKNQPFIQYQKPSNIYQQGSIVLETY